jgi:mannose-6-phosphate isomerase-like protein (cupin superfamily)
VPEQRLSSPNLSGLEEFAFQPERIDKPWGHELVWALSEHYAGKLLHITAGQRLSLQFHREKDETLYLLEGRAEIELAAPGEKATTSEVVTPGAAFRIRPGTVHRITAIENAVFLEVSTPHLDDVVRLEDVYGRAPTADS